MKIAIVHDHLGFRGGGERTMLMLAIELEADFITAYSHPDTFPEYQQELGSKLKILSKNVIQTRVMRFFWLRFLFWKNRNIFKDYDLLIASAPTSTEAVAHYSLPKTVKMVYTHTTPRRVFDQYKSSKQMYPFYLRPLYIVFAKFWKYLYLNAARKYDFNIANSNNTRKRIINHTGGDANAVVWPPILTEQFKWISDGDYFLSYARIDEAKRVDLIVKAFQKMPDKKLIVASSGPKYDLIKKLAEGFENIKILGWVSDNQLFELVGNCQAIIYIPIDEDAGMTHLEANAAGKPVLGVREGGLAESIIDGETGIMVKANPSEIDIIKATETMTKDWCIARKNICIDYAKQFDKQIFINKIKKIIAENNPSLPLLGIDASRWEDPQFPGKHKRTGVEYYSSDLIKQIVKQHDGNKLRLRLYTKRHIQALPLKYQKIIPHNKKWTRKWLVKEMKHSPPDFFLTPSYYIPKNAPANSYAIIHDVIFKHSPKLYSWKNRFFQNLAIKKNISRAHKLITVSKETEKQLNKYYILKDNQTVTVPMGYEKKYHTPSSIKKEKAIYYIGRIEKKKSVDVLIKAFIKFNQNNPDWKLWLIGKEGHGSEEILKLTEGQKNIVKFGHISDNRKKELLGKATIFVHPSQNEGSSIPLLEAWDAGLPAIVSDTDAMKEIGQDACLYFKENELTEKLSQLIKDEKLQNKLINAGKHRLKDFSWEKTAIDILKIVTNNIL